MRKSYYAKMKYTLIILLLLAGCHRQSSLAPLTPEEQAEYEDKLSGATACHSASYGIFSDWLMEVGEPNSVQVDGAVLMNREGYLYYLSPEPGTKLRMSTQKSSIYLWDLSADNVNFESAYWKWASQWKGE